MNKLSFDIFATWVKAHFKSDRGATMVEYALMAALIAVVCIAAVTMLGGNAKSKFNSVGSSIGNANP
jgi:pilus assembly protein Flp/PilA